MSRAGYWARELAIIGAITLVALLVMRWFDADRQRGGGGALPVGLAAPAFALTSVAGGEAVSLEALRGKPVILAFWATHCGPCRSELPDLERVHREAGGRYVLLGVSSEPAAAVREFLAEQGLSFTTLSDPRGAVFDAYRVRTIPTTVIIDAQGAVVHDFTGPADASALREHMEHLLGG